MMATGFITPAQLLLSSQQALLIRYGQFAVAHRIQNDKAKLRRLRRLHLLAFRGWSLAFQEVAPTL
jgi:hypothetical protein